MDDLERALRTHPFVHQMDPAHLKTLVGCAKSQRFHAGDYLMRAGEREDTLYLIRQGSVAVELSHPGADAVVLETLEAGDVVGVSLLTPVPAHLDVRARDTVLALALDNQCLLRKMEEDPRLGYSLSMRLLQRTYERLARARLQHLDVYK
jgi:CRP/FNR family transcriptional regulator, cyclic AMP receptor protein